MATESLNTEYLVLSLTYSTIIKHNPYRTAVSLVCRFTTRESQAQYIILSFNVYYNIIYYS